jgi:hypothetical protein
MTAVDPTCDRQLDVAPRRRRRLEAFHPWCRRYVAGLTCCSAELEDLADTFPALLFALVSGYGTAATRERAFELVAAGASLRQVAEALGLPWWLRRLPAGAFIAPLATFPREPEFCLHIANLIPHDHHVLPVWLERVSHAVETGGDAYALWLARQRDLAGPSADLFAFMAAWAWFSTRPGLLGHRLLRRPWSPQMSFKRAREELAAWRQRLRLIECLGPGIESPWLADATAGGFDFVALRTVEDFIAESEALENCLDQYADQLHAGLTAVFSVRKGARRIACVEIGLHDEEVSMPNIVQLRAARNRRAPPEIWQATYSWLGGQRLSPLSPLRHAPKGPQRVEARRHLWSPYLARLDGTRHAGAFRRLVLHPPRAPAPDPRRTRLRPLRGEEPTRTPTGAAEPT